MAIKKVKVNLIEDTEGYDKALTFEIGVKLEKQGFDLRILQRFDGDLIEQDLAAGLDILIVDYDLGTHTGDEIISKVNEFPDYQSLPIIFYSGGEPVDSLKKKTEKYGNVRCSTKNEVGRILVELITKKF